tara:strand:- start:121 stop:399 length:279 start_codon:yes stop_codon:yes gene_type:complete
MSIVTKTIDMTPDEAQSTRIYAYILASVTNGSPYDFGDYWNYTPEESLAIRFAYMKMDSLLATFEDVGIDRRDVPKGAIKKLVKASIASYAS